MLYKLVALIGFILLISGCGMITNTPPQNSYNQKNAEQQKKTQQSKKEQITSVPPEQVFKEVPFDTVAWTPSDFHTKATAGIFLYTKEAHAGSIDDDFSRDWADTDVLYIQLGKDYRGYEIEPIGIEIRTTKIARIVLKVKATKDAGNADEDPANVFIKVPRGSLKGYSFEVVDETGKQLKLN